MGKDFPLPPANRESLLRRIRMAADGYGAKTKLAEVLGYSRRTVYNKLKKDDGFSDAELESAAAALLGGVPEDYQEGPGDAPRQAVSANPDDFIFLPRYEIRAAAGGGSAVVSEQVVDHLAFRSDWVRQTLGIDPRNLLLIEAIGESMVPTIRPGDLMLVHIRIQRLVSGAVYAIGVDDDVIVKRLDRRTDGSVKLLSDNPAFAPEEVPPERIEQLRVIGRVVWIGRQL